MNKILLFLCIIFTGLSFFASAQNTNYVINAKGEKVACDFKSSIFGGSLKYRTDSTGKFEEVDPFNVKAYHRKNDAYVHSSVATDYGQIFLERIETGKINLYQYQAGSGQYGKEIKWYIEKNGEDGAALIKANSLIKDEKAKKDLFKALIADNSSASRLYNPYDFSFETIQRIVHIYNIASAVH